MNTEVLKAFVAQIVRWMAAPVIAWVSHNFGITEDVSSSFIVGAVVFGVMFIWGLIQKMGAEKQVEAALKMPADSTRAQLKSVLKTGKM